MNPKQIQEIDSIQKELFSEIGRAVTKAQARLSLIKSQQPAKIEVTQ